VSDEKKFEDSLITKEEVQDPPHDLDLYMHDFLEAIDAHYTLWHLTYPEEPQAVGGSEGHKAGYAAFIQALRGWQEAHEPKPQADDAHVQDYAAEVKLVLGAIAGAKGDSGIVDAVVTDRSVLRDFKVSAMEASLLAMVLGVEVSNEDCIWELAQRVLAAKVAKTGRGVQ